MPRRPRLHVAGGIYHVTLRGNHRQPIFASDQDRDLLEELLVESLIRYGGELLAYCWMSNHIHAALRIGDAPLGRLVQHFASRYARKVQRRVPTTGHLFERRHHAALVDSDAYLMAVIRYIHLNPVRAGLVKHPLEYPWSSHRSYLGLTRQDWVCVQDGLALFGLEPERSRVAFARFVNTAPDEEELASIRQGQPPAGAAGQPPGVIAERERQGRHPVGPAALEELIRQVATGLDVPAESLDSPCRARVLSRARAQIAHEALRARIATVSDLAARFRRTPATIWSCMQRYDPVEKR